MQAGMTARKTQARGRLKRAAFFCALIALWHLFTVARAGEPSGSPVPVFRSVNPALGRHLRLTAKGRWLNRNTGAFIMAVHSLGATASVSPIVPPAEASPGLQRPAPHLVHSTSSRTRRNHGTFLLGGQLAAVYSARGAGKRFGVSFEVGAGALCVDARMTAGQARNIATALLAAATAVDGTQGGVE